MFKIGADPESPFMQAITQIKQLCDRDQNNVFVDSVAIMIELMEEFLYLYKDQPYFYWSFFNDLSHSHLTPIGLADKPYYGFFEQAYAKGNISFNFFYSGIWPCTASPQLHDYTHVSGTDEAEKLFKSLAVPQYLSSAVSLFYLRSDYTWGVKNVCSSP